MRSSKIIGWAAAAVALWYGILRGAKSLFVGVRNFQLQSISLADNTATFVLNFVIKNPLLVGIRLQSVAGDVYIQGIQCGKVGNQYNYFLSGGRAHNIPVAVTISLSGLTDALIANINSGDVRTLTIDFDGGVSVGDNGIVYIPIQKTITWEDLKR